MTARRDPDQLIHRFLLEGSERLDDQIYDAVRAAVDRKPQRVVIGPWRLPEMNKILTIGLAAAAVVVAVFVGAQLFGSPNGGLGSDPSPTAEATARAAPGSGRSPRAEALTSARSGSERRVNGRDRLQDRADANRRLAGLVQVLQPNA